MTKTPFTRIYDKFEYHLEDVRCCDCLHYRKKLGCPHDKCLYETEKTEAIANDRIKREPGWFKWDM